MSRRALIAVSLAAALVVSTGAVWFARIVDAPLASTVRAAGSAQERETGAAVPVNALREGEATAGARARRTTPTGLLDDARRVRTEGSLRGADRDGDVSLGADGRLRIDRALRRLFDWYLSMTGELDRAAIRALVQADVAIEFGPGVAAQVLAEFDRYAGYLEIATTIPPQASDEVALAMLRALRRERLGAAVAEAFFRRGRALCGGDARAPRSRARRR